MTAFLLLLTLPLADTPPGCCVPQTEIDKVKHIFYSCKVDEICLPRRPGWCLLGCFRRGCEPEGSCPTCRPEPRPVRKLVKTIVTEERPVCRCKVLRPEPPAAANVP